MALPTSRDTTYAANAQVKSADLNDIQDWLIAALAGKQAGQRKKVINPTVGMSSLASWVYNPPGATAAYWELAASTGPAVMIVPIPHVVGERIIQLEVLVSAAAVVTNVTASLRKVVGAAGGTFPSAAEATIVAAQNMPSAVATMQKIIVTPTGPGYVTVVDEWYFLRVTGANSAGAKELMRVDYIYDVP